jgi:acetyl-CoA acetyltransferase
LREMRPDVLSALTPLFRLDGTVTAGHACPPDDGAAHR